MERVKYEDVYLQAYDTVSIARASRASFIELSASLGPMVYVQLCSRVSVSCNSRRGSGVVEGPRV